MPLISQDDIEAFREYNAGALSQAAEYARRAEKGLPVDRWASTRQAYLVAQGIRAMQQIIALQTEAIEVLTHANAPPE